MISFSVWFPGNVSQWPPHQDTCVLFSTEGKVQWCAGGGHDTNKGRHDLFMFIIIVQNIVIRLNQIGVKFRASSCRTLPLAYDWVWRFVLSIMIERIKWDLELSSFIFVPAVCLLSEPLEIIALSSSILEMLTTVAFSTVTTP